MKLLKGLLYTRNNAALDISRLCALLSILCFWGGVFYALSRGGAFDPLAIGSGCAALFAGAAGWIHMRQRHEGGQG